MGFLHRFKAATSQTNFDRHNLATYPEPARTNLCALQDSFDCLVKRDAEALRQYGLPTPPIRLNFDPQAWGSSDFRSVEVSISIKEEDFPRTASFRLRPLGVTKIPSWIPAHARPPLEVLSWSRETVDELLEAALTYTVRGDRETVNAAEHDVIHSGISEVVRKYEGQWTNRHPYGVFRVLQRLKPFVVDATKKIEFDRFSLSEWPERKLEKLQGFSYEEVRDIEVQARLFNSFTSCLPRGPYIYGSPSSRVSPEVLSNIVLHALEVTEQITVKVLPTEKTNAGLLMQFLSGLHNNLREQIVFEIVKEGERIYFQLTTSKSDYELLERQLETLFPDFEVIPNDAVPESPTPFYVISVKPFHCHTSLKTIRDFYVDPYVQLLGTLDRLKSEETVCVQVHFLPFRYFNLLSKNFEWFRASQEKAQPDGKLPSDITDAITEREKALKKKDPAWLLAIRLFVTNRDTLFSLSNSFLNQFKRSTEQFFETRDDDRHIKEVSTITKVIIP